MTREKLEKKLYNKAAKEQKKYVKNLKKINSNKILKFAYEFVLGEDILMALKEPNFLTNEQIEALLLEGNIISNCYSEWLDNNYSYMNNMIRDTIKMTANRCEPPAPISILESFSKEDFIVG